MSCVLALVRVEAEYAAMPIRTASATMILVAALRLISMR